MQFLIILAVAVGVCLATPARFLQNTPEVQEATINFIREYNRLARLAADAPDIHIYKQSDQQLQRVDSAPVPQQQIRPAQSARVVQNFAPLQGQDVYSYSANLGGNQQFHPSQFHSFLQPQPAAQVQSFRRQPAPQHFQPQPVAHIQHFDQDPATQIHQPRWTGPLADTVPAGVNGLPQQVTYSPEVQEARNAHFQVLSQAYQAAASRIQPQHFQG